MKTGCNQKVTLKKIEVPSGASEGKCFGSDHLTLFLVSCLLSRWREVSFSDAVVTKTTEGVEEMAALGKIRGLSGLVLTASVGFKEDIIVRGTMSFGGDVVGGGGDLWL